VISGDGRHVAFLGEIGVVTQVYVKDLDTGVLEMVSVNNAGQPAEGHGTDPSNRPSISNNGQVVAFAGEYCNSGLGGARCPTPDPRYVSEIWVRDRIAGTLTLGSVLPSGAPATSSDDEVGLSADGRYLSFDNMYNASVPECVTAVNGGNTLWRRDLVAGTTQRINTDVDGDACAVAAQWSPQTMTADGNSIVYTAMHGAYVSATNPEAVYITKLG
jgi:Tol biopolymer transport system component